MKKNLKSMFTFVAILCLAICLGVNASAALDATGQCGDNAYWEFNETTGELVISGEGAMWDDIYFSDGNIKSVTIENGITSIGRMSFSHCDKLSDVSLPDSLITIGEGAFNFCVKLENVFIPDSVTHIDDYAFRICKALKTITIPSNVSELGICVFEYCENLESINVDENNEFYSNDLNGVLFNKDKSILIQYPIGNKATSYSIPNGVEKFNERAFEECNNLKSISIPDSVLEIEDYTFYYCENLENITIGNNVEKIGDAAFADCVSIKKIIIPDSVKSIGNSSFASCTNLSEITLPGTLIYIDVGAFAYCDKLSDIYYKGSEKMWKQISIGEYNEPIMKANIHFLVVECEHTDIKEIVVHPTCTEDGTRTYICDECEELIGEEVIYATGHIYEEDSNKCSVCGYDRIKNCSCNCHKGGIKGFFFKFLLFFQKIFKTNRECKCGISHY